QELRKAYQRLADGLMPVDAFLKLRADNLAARKIGHEAAETYAARVMSGVRAVRENYIKELNQGEMVGWAIRGLYRRLEIKDLQAAGRERLQGEVPRHRHADPPGGGQGRPAGRDADQGQSGVPGGPPGRRPHHPDRDRPGRQGQGTARAEGLLDPGDEDRDGG